MPGTYGWDLIWENASLQMGLSQGSEMSARWTTQVSSNPVTCTLKRRGKLGHGVKVGAVRGVGTATGWGPRAVAPRPQTEPALPTPRFQAAGPGSTALLLRAARFALICRAALENECTPGVSETQTQESGCHLCLRMRKLATLWTWMQHGDSLPPPLPFQGHTTVLQPSMPHTERQAHTRPPRERRESGPRTQLDRAKLLGNAPGPFPSETVKPTALGCSKILRKP